MNVLIYFLLGALALLMIQTIFLGIQIYLKKKRGEKNEK